jgi:hypothetical protein
VSDSFLQHRRETCSREKPIIFTDAQTAGRKSGFPEGKAKSKSDVRNAAGPSSKRVNGGKLCLVILLLTKET